MLIGKICEYFIISDISLLRSDQCTTALKCALVRPTEFAINLWLTTISG